MIEERCAACREDVEAWKADHVFDLNDCLTLLERHHALLAAKDEEIAKLQRNREEIDILYAASIEKRYALQRERDAARAKVEELSGALKGVIRAQHHRRYHRRDHEQCESCKAIGIARRALEEGEA